MSARKEEYMALPKARALLEIIPLADAEAGAKIKCIIRAIVEGKRGVDPLADAALDNEEAYREQRTEAARTRWENRKPARTVRGVADAPHGAVDAPHGMIDAPHESVDAPHEKNMHIPTYQHTNQQTDIQNQPTNPTNKEAPAPVGVGDGNVGGIAGRALAGLTVGAGGDPLRRFMASPKDTVWQLPDSSLPSAVALYCGADNRERTEAAFKKILPLVGASRFRREFGRFIAEGEQGELDTVRDRAACFMARLKESNTP